MENSNLTVGDVTRMALSMEERGFSFYNWAAQQFHNEDVTNMFIRLAQEEKEHAMVFKRLMDLPDTGEEVSADTGRYLRILAESGVVFPDHQDISHETVKTPADALAVGIQAEKDSILFYH
ncbi:MAG: ferritin-like domain-containing protein [Eubacteriales bacterium]